MKHYYTRWGIHVLILALLSIGLTPVGQGAVLCRAADGRIEMKAGFGSSCHPHINSSEGSGAAEYAMRFSREDCCGPCNHTPLSNLDVSASLCAKKKTSHTDRPYRWTKASPAPVFDFVRDGPESQFSASTVLILLTRCTVVLLI